MNWLEKHFRKYAIRNLSLIVIICYGFGYLLQAVNASFLNYLTLNPYAIVHGQVWRLFTWVLVPPDTSNVIFVIIAMLFYYSIGTALERTWGTWEYNVYIFSGLLFTVIGSFVNMGITYLAMPVVAEVPGMAASVFSQMALFYSTSYVCLSITLAYAATFPNAVVLFMFILPIKIKWLGIVYGFILAYEFIRYAVAGAWYACIAIAASLLNFIIFYFQTRRQDLARFSPKEMRRKAAFRRGMKQPGWKAEKGSARKAGQESGAGRDNDGNAAGGASTVRAEQMRPRGRVHHRCAICGRTDLDDPTLEFRYCSKCQGNFEFCQDHLWNHIHAVNGQGPKPMGGSGN